MSFAVIAWFVVLAVVAWGLPALAARGVVRSLERRGHTVENWRGRRVAPALGVVWLTWALGMAVLAAVWSVAGAVLGDGESLQALLPATFVVETAPLFLVLGAYALGLLDDAYGDHADRGIRGHLRALREGRLTTGTVKLVGIGALALVQSASLGYEGTVDPATGAFDWLPLIGAWLLATVVIAGSANLVNLTDLRPTRALKTYGVLALVAVGALGLDVWVEWGASSVVTAKAALAVVLFGPLLAAWGPDARERAMLGDAGSNAAGALVGYSLALALPTPVLVGVAVLLVALNIASEWVSFSEVIEKVPPLRWFDGLGRQK